MYCILNSNSIYIYSCTLLIYSFYLYSLTLIILTSQFIFKYLISKSGDHHCAGAHSNVLVAVVVFKLPNFRHGSSSTPIPMLNDFFSKNMFKINMFLEDGDFLYTRSIFQFYSFFFYFSFFLSFTVLAFLRQTVS